MIGSLRGALLDRSVGGEVLVEVAGVGYRVQAGPVTAALITGQLGLALVIDQFGWLGIDRRPLTLTKVAGIALLVAGTYLVVRE